MRYKNNAFNKIFIMSKQNTDMDLKEIFKSNHCQNRLSLTFSASFYNTYFRDSPNPAWWKPM